MAADTWAESKGHALATWLIKLWSRNERAGGRGATTLSVVQALTTSASLNWWRRLAPLIVILSNILEHSSQSKSSLLLRVPWTQTRIGLFECTAALCRIEEKVVSGFSVTILSFAARDREPGNSALRIVCLAVCTNLTRSSGFSVSTIWVEPVLTTLQK